MCMKWLFAADENHPPQGIYSFLSQDLTILIDFQLVSSVKWEILKQDIGSRKSTIVFYSVNEDNEIILAILRYV